MLEEGHACLSQLAQFRIERGAGDLQVSRGGRDVAIVFAQGTLDRLQSVLEQAGLSRYPRWNCNRSSATYRQRCVDASYDRHPRPCG